MIKKTKDYDIFIFREDNREKIDQLHVKKIAESIVARNLLELRPIIVNDKMEVMDGQHRLLAAKMLAIDIYYIQEKKLCASDIIRMNINKPWSESDYLNFHCQHQNDEYMKLKNFMKKHGLSLRVALNITRGEGKEVHNKFKMGEFQFDEENLDDELDICKDTISYIKKMNGHSNYTKSSRFWKAMIRLIRHPDFKEEKWHSNVQKLVDYFSPKASMIDYVTMISKIYNYRSTTTINLMDNEE